MLCGGVGLSSRIPHAPSRFPDLGRIEQETGFAYNRDCLASGDQLNFSSQCYDSADRRSLVAVWGDSHSNALAPELHAIATESNLGFVQISHSACLPLMNAAFYVTAYPETARDCMAFNQHAMNFLLSNSQIRIVVIASRWALFFPPGGGDGWAFPAAPRGHQMLTQDAAGVLFRSALTASVERLLQAGKQVVVLEDTPTFDFVPLNRFRTSQIPARRLLAGWMGSEEADDLGCAPLGELPAVTFANARLKETIAAIPGVPLIDLLSEFRQENGLYAYRIGEYQLFSDSHHLTHTELISHCAIFIFPLRSLIDPITKICAGAPSIRARFCANGWEGKQPHRPSVSDGSPESASSANRRPESAAMRRRQSSLHCPSRGPAWGRPRAVRAARLRTEALAQFAIGRHAAGNQNPPRPQRLGRRKALLHQIAYHRSSGSWQSDPAPAASRAQALPLCFAGDALRLRAQRSERRAPGHRPRSSCSSTQRSTAVLIPEKEKRRCGSISAIGAVRAPLVRGTFPAKCSFVLICEKVKGTAFGLPKRASASIHGPPG